MTRPALPPVFVKAETAAELCEVSRDTWDAWVHSGFVPPPAVDRGQIMRWHWPTVEAALAGRATTVSIDPFVQGARNVGEARARKARKEGRHRGAA